MKILIICSKQFYNKIPNIKQQLEKCNHKIFLPNCFENPTAEFENWENGTHSDFKARMFLQSEKTISKMDAVLVLNFDKAGKKNYIGGATFLEMYDAFRLNKKIYLFNNIEKSCFSDEIDGFSPIIINKNLNLIK